VLPTVFSPPPQPGGSGPGDRFRRRFGRVGLLLLSDALAVLGSFWLPIFLRGLADPLAPELYLGVTPVLLLAPLLGPALGTCRRIMLPPHRELKALSISVTLGFAALMILLFAAKRGEEFSRLVVIGAWLCSLFAVPAARSLLRRRFCRKSWWSVPLVLIGSEKADELRAALEARPERGLRVAEHIAGPFRGMTPELEAAAERHPTSLALLLPDAFAGNPSEGKNLSLLLAQLGRGFRGVLLFPPLIAENPFIWLTPRDLGHSVALLARQNLYDANRLMLKRALDLTGIILCSFWLLPLGALIALCIKADSPGPVFYRHERIGLKGRRIRVLKFRSMAQNAEETLRRRLAEDETLRREWEESHKLKRDPRITRVGAFLRKTSLDELPQLWNVLKGEMSLVGPRPIVRAEVEKYGAIFEEYLRVKPGITGLWQISGRNDTSYEERIRLDRYYVSNWSIWFDIWILARTVPVALFGRGAY
jgi:Undecaprenyl-phosphate galactose phosphotransferase WbaP